MSLQHAAIDLLDHAAQALTGLADGSILPGDCRYAGAKLAAAATRLRVEPCRPEDIQACFNIMCQARPHLQSLRDATLPDLYRGWIEAACYAYNAVIDLLEGLQAFHKHVSLDQTGVLTLGDRLRRLLPTGWWGSHV
jgi:hypothetical protein